MGMHTHINSIAAYISEREKLSARKAAVLLWFQAHPGSHTDRSVLASMYPPPDGELGMVQPRISDLIREGWLVETESVIGDHGRAVRLVQARSQAEILEPEPKYVSNQMALL